MRATGPHRKRQANKGRYANAMLVCHGFVNVSSTAGDRYSCVREAVRIGSSVKAGDAITIRETEHRNRFGAEHRLSITAPNVAQVRNTLKLAARTLQGVKFDQEIGQFGLITIKVASGARELLSFINQSRSDRLFTVESAVCSDRTAMCASTVRRLHGSY